MRLFIAIPLPAPVKKTLKKLQEPAEGIRWQPASQLHLTLKFLGEISPDQFNRLKKELSVVEASPFTLIISGVGVFPDKEQPRVFWAGIEQSSALQNLYDAIEQAAETANFKKESRTYMPHITLGKVKNLPTHSVNSWIDSHADWGSRKLLINRFTLFASRLNAGGATHKTIETYFLNA